MTRAPPKTTKQNAGKLRDQSSRDVTLHGARGGGARVQECACCRYGDMCGRRRVLSSQAGVVLLLSSCHMLAPHFTPSISFPRDAHLSTRFSTAGSAEYCACRFAKLLRSLHTDPSNLVHRNSLVVPKQSSY